MKLVILGLDSLNYELINKCKDVMPCLFNHLKNDLWGKLRTTIPYFTGPTWTSFQTGKNIGNHGIANFLKYDDNFNLSLISGSDIHEKTFYELADQNGLNCFIMNLPYSYPPKIEGDVVFSWLHIYDNIEELFWPSSLINHYTSLNNYQNRADRSRSEIKYLKSAYQVLISQENVVKEIITSGDHNVCFFLLNAADMVQHKVFDLLMEGTNNKKTELGKRILKRLDGLVQWIDDNSGDDTVVLIASDHGFKIYDGRFFINSWLRNNGYLITSKEGKQLKEVINRRQKKKGNLDISKLIIFVKRHPIIFKSLEPFYDFFVRYCPFDLVKQPGIDFSKSKAYCRSSFEGTIFLNGAIDNHKKTELKKEIISGLNKLPDIRAFDCNEFYKGKFSSQLGDILVTSDKFEMDSTIGSNEFLRIPRNMHSLYGIFMAYGKGIKKKHQLSDARIWDVTPTILHLLNIPIPHDMDGKVLDIFDPGFDLFKRKSNYLDVITKKAERSILNQAIKNLQI